MNALGRILHIAALCLLTGCRTVDESGTITHADVQVSGHSLQQIQQATAEVFKGNGYTEKSRTPDRMVFDRPGSGWDAAKYGNWFGDGVVMRVKVEFVELSKGTYRLTAVAYAVQNAEDPFFRDENRVMTLSRRHYQKLLDKVAKALD